MSSIRLLQLSQIKSPGFPSGSGFNISLTDIKPCTRLFAAFRTGRPHSPKICAIVLPVSFCVDHISGGAIVYSMRSRAGVSEIAALAASETISLDSLYCLYT